LNAGLLHGDCGTITGETIAETLVDVPDEPPKGQSIILPFDQPLYDSGHLAILKGNLAEEGAVAKITGVKEPVITGPARVFDSDEDAMAAILDETEIGRASCRERGGTIAGEGGEEKQEDSGGG